MSVSKILLIAKREFWVNFRRRSFLFTAFGVPVITSVALLIVFRLLGDSLQDVSAYKAVGIVDTAAVVAAPSGQPAITLDAPFVWVSGETEAAAKLKDKSLDAYYVIPADFMTEGKITSYHRPELTISESINDRFEEVLKAALAARFGDANLSQRLVDPLDKVKIFRVGNPQELDESALFGSFFVPFIVVMLVFSAIISTSQFILSGLAEEKENRMMELFATSARPTEMLWGKVLGLGGLGLSQLLIWVSLGAALAALQGNLDIGRQLANYSITPSFLGLLLVYFLLGYLVYGTIMAGLGALVNAEQEGRQYAGLISLLAIAPVLFITQFLENPNGQVPTFLSLFPFTSPIGMIMRLSWASVPPEHVLLSIGLLVATAAAMIWVSARLMRIGMLNYGKKLNLRDILRSLIEGRTLISSGEIRDDAAGAKA
jgi:ABC-2 type transport system permease protein